MPGKAHKGKLLSRSMMPSFTVATNNHICADMAESLSKYYANLASNETYTHFTYGLKSVPLKNILDETAMFVLMELYRRHAHEFQLAISQLLSDVSERRRNRADAQCTAMEKILTDVGKGSTVENYRHQMKHNVQEMMKRHNQWLEDDARNLRNSPVQLSHILNRYSNVEHRTEYEGEEMENVWDLFLEEFDGANAAEEDEVGRNISTGPSSSTVQNKAAPGTSQKKKENLKNQSGNAIKEGGIYISTGPSYSSKHHRTASESSQITKKILESQSGKDIKEGGRHISTRTLSSPVQNKTAFQPPQKKKKTIKSKSANEQSTRDIIVSDSERPGAIEEECARSTSAASLSTSVDATVTPPPKTIKRDTNLSYANIIEHGGGPVDLSFLMEQLEVPN